MFRFSLYAPKSDGRISLLLSCSGVFLGLVRVGRVFLEELSLLGEYMWKVDGSFGGSGVCEWVRVLGDIFWKV